MATAKTSQENSLFNNCHSPYLPFIMRLYICIYHSIVIYSYVNSNINYVEVTHTLFTDLSNHLSISFSLDIYIYIYIYIYNLKDFV